MADITPTKIAVAQIQLDQLQQRLALATFPDELEDADWEYGAPLADIKRLTQYWRIGYDWRKHEEKLNELPHFRTLVGVEGFGALDIHFVHQRSGVKGAIPLLFVHGWPGSFHEVVKLLPLLSNAGDGGPAFHIVAPSLPNFGFSEGVKKKGFRLPQYAETLHNLMLKLGYNEYVTQGGDWGFWITRTIGRLYPASCKASHINMLPTKPPTLSEHPLLYEQHAVTPYTDEEKAGIERSKWFEDDGYGYNHLQRTKPQTIGYALADSPVGLLAWIYEKLHDWTDSYPFTDDEILTWVSIYLFSKAGVAASLRIYREAQNGEEEVLKAARGYVPDVKLGVAQFPRDICVWPKIWRRTLGPVVLESDHASGGHFATFEQPDAIATDLKKMFGKDGDAFGVVQGKNGYDTQ